MLDNQQVTFKIYPIIVANIIENIYIYDKIYKKVSQY